RRAHTRACRAGPRRPGDARRACEPRARAERGAARARGRRPALGDELPGGSGDDRGHPRGAHAHARRGDPQSLGGCALEGKPGSGCAPIARGRILVRNRWNTHALLVLTGVLCAGAAFAEGSTQPPEGGQTVIYYVGRMYDSGAAETIITCTNLGKVDVQVLY